MIQVKTYDYHHSILSLKAKERRYMMTGGSKQLSVGRGKMGLHLFS